MNSRERMLAAIDHQPVDRIPTDMWATPEVLEKLRAHFGEGVDINEALGIDSFATTGPMTYIGPAIGEGAGVPGAAWGPVNYDVPESADNSSGETVDFWGIRRKTIDYGTGVYDEQCYAPLADARTIDDLERYRWPQADWFDYSAMREPTIAAREHHAIQCGYMAPFYLHNQLRGFERSLMDPLDDPRFTHHFLDRLCDFFYEQHRRMFETCAGLIDVAQVTDDYGSQTGPMIGLAVFREFYKPHLQRFIDLCHEFGIKVMHHDDGAIRPFLPDLVEMGIDILNPIQWTCPGMDREGLKRDFGDRVCFHGAVENQRIIPFGTPEEVRAEVRACIDTLASDGTGYVLAPCHNVQPVTPIENILALFDEAQTYGAR